jgi:hypothetical protein
MRNRAQRVKAWPGRDTALCYRLCYHVIPGGQASGSIDRSGAALPPALASGPAGPSTWVLTGFAYTMMVQKGGPGAADRRMQTSAT